MNIANDELEKIQLIFPELFLNDEQTRIVGEISFNACFDGTKLHLDPAKDNNRKIFSGYYEIEIRLDDLDIYYGLPKVFETSGKIIKFGEENDIQKIDLHLNGDYSCCLGIFTPGEVKNMSLYNYIVEYVFSFFAWQAYRTTYMEKPPWGEYSHFNGKKEKGLEIFQNMSKAGRNDPCPCGSTKKFKKCCLTPFQNFQKRKR